MTSLRDHADGEDTLVRILSEVLSTTLFDVDIASTLQLRRLNYFARRLHYRVAVISDLKAKQVCVQLIEQLPLDAADRILRSPALCEALRVSGDTGVLIELLEGETALATVDTIVYREGWSAMGNVWLGDKLPIHTFPLESRDGRFIGPELECGVPLDLSLPPFVRRPTAGLQSPRYLDSAETCEAVEVLNASVNLLRDSWPTGHSVLVGLTSNIVLRVDTERPTESWSASSGGAIGRTVLANPMVAGGAHLLAEFLLHEATHSALDCAELDSPLIRDSNDLGGAVVLSPWTGNQLSVHAFLHACVVWAALLEYWSRYRAAGSVGEYVRERCEVIRRGFERVDVDRCLEPFRSSLSDAAFQVVATASEFALG